MKTHKFLTSLIAVLTISATGAFATPVFASDSSDAKDAITATKSDTEKLLDQIAAANAEVIKLDSQISTKNTAIDAAKTKIDTTTKRIGQLSGQITTAKKEVSARKGVMKKQLVSLQKQAGDSATGNIYVDFVLNADNLSDLVSRTFTVNKLNQANKDAMDAVSAAETKLTGLKGEQEDKKADLVATETKLENEKAALVGLKAEAKSKNTALNKKIKANKSTLVALQKQFAKATAKEAKQAQLAAEAKAAAAAQLVAKKAAAKAMPVEVAAAPAAKAAKSQGTSHANFASSGNSYPWGQCTWYVKQVAPWVGNNWGNGGDWDSSAAAAGFTVNNSPAAGTVIVFQQGQSVGGQWSADGAYGHVGYVQSYDAAANTVTISQGGMGFDSPTGPNTQTISNASNYTFIHQ